MTFMRSWHCTDFTEKLTKWLVGNLKFLNKKTAVVATQVAHGAKADKAARGYSP